MLLPISAAAKGVLWTVLFGLAKTCQYGGLTILGVEGYRRLKSFFGYKTNNIEQMKKVIVISTSLRRGSNSDMLAEQFVQGATAAGHDVEKISLDGKTIQFCKGCMGCQKLGRCVINDDVNDLMAKVLEADVVCWATPIYYYEMSGQMKTLIDRMNGMYGQDYHFREVYLLTTAAEDEPSTPKRAEAGLTGWIDCYPKSRLVATLFCGGVNEAREIEGNPKLQEAYELGKRV